MTDDGQFNARRGRSAAIVAAALATGKTVERAAKVGGVGTRTVYKWLKKPTFKARVDELRDRAVNRAVSLLATDMAKAAKALGSLLSSPDEATRLKAARAVLELGVKSREAVAVAERLADVEKRLRAGE